MKETRISIVVQGRFHAFALAKALIELGSPVQVLTNYPAFIAERFGIPAASMRGIGSLGLLHRYANRWGLTDRIPLLNRLLHQSFSLWASRHITRTEPVAVHAFSGVALELFQHLRTFKNPIMLQLARGSCHIRDQYHLLNEEGRRAGTAIEKPSVWMIRREQEEYRLSDNIVTLSSFARNTFLHRGYTEDKVVLLPLGADVSRFRPERDVIDARLRRIRSGAPLSMLCTGTVCLRKGLFDLVRIAEALQGQIHFRCVGNILPEARPFVDACSRFVEFVPRQPEHDLSRYYNEADGFVLPTIEDGFAVVLTQAQAAALPILASTHCAAPDMVKDGETGWSLPIRRPDMFVDKLRAWNADREGMAQMVETLWQENATRDWPAVAEDFVAIVRHAVTLRQARHAWET